MPDPNRPAHSQPRKSSAKSPANSEANSPANSPAHSHTNSPPNSEAVSRANNSCSRTHSRTNSAAKKRSQQAKPKSGALQEACHTWVKCIKVEAAGEESELLLAGRHVDVEPVKLLEVRHRACDLLHRRQRDGDIRHVNLGDVMA